MDLVFVIGPFDTEYLNAAVTKQRSLPGSCEQAAQIIERK
jgi:hypothetical protein